MTARVDFYVLKSAATDDSHKLACRLAEKAWHCNYRVLIHTDSPHLAGNLDDLLWTFKQDSFVPHGLHSEDTAEDTPVIVGDGRDPGGEFDVLINLSGVVPEFCDRFARIVEIVNASETSRRSARDRFRAYRARGCDLKTHDL